MKKFPISLLCGLLAMLLTVILFFTFFGSTILTAIHFITLLAVLLAEGVTTVYAYNSNGPRGVAAAVVSGFMIPYSVTISLVYIANFPKGYATYIGWYCAGMVVVNAIALILLRFDSGKKAENAQLQATKGNMLELRKMVMCALAEPNAKPYEKQLRAIEEKLHFSNDSVIVAEDENIRQLLLQLQESVVNPDADTEQLLKDIEKTIEKRNIMASGRI